MPCAFQREPFHQTAPEPGENRKPDDIPLEFGDGPTSVLPPVTGEEAAGAAEDIAKEKVKGQAAKKLFPRVMEHKKKFFEENITADEAKLNVEAIAGKTGFVELLKNPDTADAVADAFVPVGAKAKATAAVVKEGGFKAGAKAVSGTAAAPASVQAAVGAEQAALGTSPAQSVNVQMGLMEQALVEQFASGRLAATVPEGTYQAGATSPAGVPQAGVAPTTGINTKLAAKAVAAPTEFITQQMALASSFVAITLLEFGFASLIPKAASKTPAASTIIKQAEEVVKSVQTPVQKFSSFVGGLLPF